MRNYVKHLRISFSDFLASDTPVDVPMSTRQANTSSMKLLIGITTLLFVLLMASAGQCATMLTTKDMSEVSGACFNGMQTGGVICTAAAGTCVNYPNGIVVKKPNGTQATYYSSETAQYSITGCMGGNPWDICYNTARYQCSVISYFSVTGCPLGGATYTVTTCADGYQGTWTAPAGC